MNISATNWYNHASTFCCSCYPAEWHLMGHFYTRFSLSWPSHLTPIKPVLQTTNTVVIQIDAHALIDAHPTSSSSSWHTKMGEIDDFLSKMHGLMMNSPYIYNYSVLWWCIRGQMSSLSFVPSSCLAHARWPSIWMNMVPSLWDCDLLEWSWWRHPTVYHISHVIFLHHIFMQLEVLH